ncbi:MAG: hypothetical protein WBY53_16700 [Acidobacteriaceae bacterium]
MAKNKTTATEASVESFLRTITPESKRNDCAALIALMSEATNHPARMWGPAIIGFDTFRYTFANGKPGEICLIGFSPRKYSLVLYITNDKSTDADLLDKLGKIKMGQACLYVNALADLHLPTFKQLLRRSVKARRQASATPQPASK